MPAASDAHTLAIELSMNSNSPGRAPGAFEQDFEDPRIGLGDADVARDDADVEFARR